MRHNATASIDKKLTTRAECRGGVRQLTGTIESPDYPIQGHPKRDKFIREFLDRLRPTPAPAGSSHRATRSYLTSTLIFPVSSRSASAC